MKLNGWRRLGIVLGSVWLLSVVGIAATDAMLEGEGWFVERTLPEGTVIAGNKATLPDGRVVDIVTRGPNGETLSPWDIKWDNEPAIPSEQHIRWLRLLATAVGLPLVVWTLAEVLSMITRWIIRGFR